MRLWREAADEEHEAERGAVCVLCGVGLPRGASSGSSSDCGNELHSVRSLHEGM